MGDIVRLPDLVSEYWLIAKNWERLLTIYKTSLGHIKVQFEWANNLNRFIENLLSLVQLS